ncbi:hypothetical protein ABT214_08310 [Micromonospora purpureochromogenes]|uniref:hypothetical protein n=1 Tax=Micromonospora TaxID=1873 RepID=UPI00332F5106
MGAGTFVVAGGTSGLGLSVARLLAADRQVTVLGDVRDEVHALPEQVATQAVRLLLDPGGRYVPGERVLRADGRW